MDNYLVYIGVVVATIMLPGPAVVFTLNNSVMKGFSKTFAGICGVSLGVFAIASISATSIRFVLESSLVAFTLIKVLGAAYLIYLGVKMFRTKGGLQTTAVDAQMSYFNVFFKGFLISITNPKGLVFFISIFPQFINEQEAYLPQFLLLAVTFCLLIVVIHTSYAMCAGMAKAKLSSEKGMSLLNKASGSLFVCFGVGLATTR